VDRHHVHRHPAATSLTGSRCNSHDLRASREQQIADTSVKAQSYRHARELTADPVGLLFLCIERPPADRIMSDLVLRYRHELTAWSGGDTSVDPQAILDKLARQELARRIEFYSMFEPFGVDLAHPTEIADGLLLFDGASRLVVIRIDRLTDLSSCFRSPFVGANSLANRGMGDLATRVKSAVRINPNALSELHSNAIVSRFHHASACGPIL
jgi:hypothetical protein